MAFETPDPEKIPVDVTQLEMLPDGKYGEPPEDLQRCGISCWEPTCRITCGLTG
jgi:hypothetical protein